MKPFPVVTVNFKCCGEIHNFQSPREFYMCGCGCSGYDAGDGFYSRILGNRDDVEIVGYDIEKNKEYCKKYGLDYHPKEGLVVKVGTPYFIKLDKCGAILMKNVDGIRPEVIGHFTALKDARKRMNKHINMDECI